MEQRLVIVAWTIPFVSIYDRGLDEESESSAELQGEKSQGQRARSLSKSI